MATVPLDTGVLLNVCDPAFIRRGRLRAMVAGSDWVELIWIRVTTNGQVDYPDLTGKTITSRLTGAAGDIPHTATGGPGWIELRVESTANTGADGDQFQSHLGRAWVTITDGDDDVPILVGSEHTFEIHHPGN